MSATERMLRTRLDVRPRAPEDLDVDAVVVGAGIAGLYATYRLRGLGLRMVVLEAGDGVGGTWYWNRYPGCRCDVPTIEYSYSFDEDLEQEWSWPEVMSAQPEIERYVNHVADRHDLRRDIRFCTRVTSMEFDEPTGTWTVQTDRGDRYTARWCVMATGSLSAPNIPDISGIDRFAGMIVHTGLWPREGVDLEGRRVAVIGTGSSGVQSIPQIAKVAQHLTVFQRTPNYAFSAEVLPLDPELEAYVKANYRELRRLQRSSQVGVSNMQMPGGDGRGVGFGALTDRAMLSDPEMQANLQAFIADNIRSRVHDPEIADSLIPKDYPVGCKRLIVEIGYFDTFNRDNVTLVDLRKGAIVEITPNSVRTEQGDFEVDVLVLASGFDALTGPLTRIDIRGRDGRSLAEAWEHGPRAYLGFLSAGFPNLFLVTGPGSPSVLSNMIVSIEFHDDLVATIIDYMRERGYATIDTTPEAEDTWRVQVDEVAVGTPFTAPTCNSWYLGANIDGKPRVFLPYIGGVDTYAATWDDVVTRGYEGFVFSPMSASGG